MARFKADEADNYASQMTGEFFSLKNDKDVAVVRFLYNDYDDIGGYSVHQIEVNGKRRYVNCLREYDDPIDTCPLCADTEQGFNKVFVKMFLLLYDVDEDKVKIWERGRTFFSKMNSLTTRYSPLVATEFEIERNGKKGDTSTTYEIYAGETDETTIDDLPEVPQILGGFVLDKTAEELEYFLNYGSFESDSADVSEQRSQNRRERSEEPVSRRRAPANEPTRRRTPRGQDRF